MAGSALPITAPTIMASISAPEPPHAESDVTDSVDARSPYLDNNESTASRGSYFDSEQTAATTVVGNDVDGCLSCDTTSTSNKEYQDVDKALPSQSSHMRGEKKATGPAPKVVEALVIGMDDLTPGRTRTGTDQDPPPIKPRQSSGSGRRDQTRLIVRGQDPAVGKADNTKLNTKLAPQDLPIYAHAFWNQLDGKHREARGVIRTVDELFNLSGPFTAALGGLPPATHACTTERESPPPWQD